MIVVNEYLLSVYLALDIVIDVGVGVVNMKKIRFLFL